jgi:hypothetical protein
LHARAIRRLRDALSASMKPAEAAKALVLAFQQKPKMAKATLDSSSWSMGGNATNGITHPGVVVRLAAETRSAKVSYASVSRTARSKSASLKGLASQRQPLSSRKRSASVPATSPVTKMTRRASSGAAAAIAR